MSEKFSYFNATFLLCGKSDPCSFQVFKSIYIAYSKIVNNQVLGKIM